MDTQLRARHPILRVLFDRQRSTAWLAREAGFNRIYLSRIFNGHIPATEAVRAKCAAVLGLPESELFHGPFAPTTEQEATKAA